MAKMKKDVRYIKCGKHYEQLAPWSIVCIHLLEGISREWIPLAQDDKTGFKGNYDWLCPACDEGYTRMIKEHDLDSLRPICMYCVETIRRKYDPNYGAECK